ncbi:MAG: 30S ribosome-binding factor RbfA [Acholeplasmatales bacterium]|jgi:ribosome-binding factor A|nr:30S ribosome-binding factor RbfA [Acholeplasmatales bacterium]
MSVISQGRIASNILREITYILNDKIKDPVVGYVNVTDVKINKDLSVATVFYTIFKNDKETLDYTKKLLNDKNALLRMELARKMQSMRKVPELFFKYDTSLEYGNHIEEILENINKQKK